MRKGAGDAIISLENKSDKEGSTMETLEAIKTRRSVKRYKPDMPPREAIEQVVEAGTWAATGKNMQSPVIVAVTNRAVRDELARENARILGQGEDFDPFYGAPVVLVVLADKSVFTHIYDGSLVMGNMMLAARELGLDSCWIHRAREEFELPRWREWLKSLGIEGEYEGIGHLVLGYGQGDYPADKPRKGNWVYYVE